MQLTFVHLLIIMLSYCNAYSVAPVLDPVDASECTHHRDHYVLVYLSHTLHNLLLNVTLAINNTVKM
jgi:hypothetical protein